MEMGSRVPSYHLRALVCAKTKLGDADMIFTLLAQDGSKVRAVAKSVRKPKSRLRGTLELFSVADLLCAQGRNLDIITEARLVDAHEGCRADIEHSSAASAVCEMLERLSLEGQPQPRLFDMCDAALRAISRGNGMQARLHTAATVLKVLSLLGYRPSLDRCALCGNPVDGNLSGFSFSEGGVLCHQCASNDHVGHSQVSANQIAWVGALIGSTYEQIAGFEAGEQVCKQMLAFAQRWMFEHTGIICRAMRFLVSDLSP